MEFQINSFDFDCRLLKVICNHIAPPAEYYHKTKSVHVPETRNDMLINLAIIKSPVRLKNIKHSYALSVLGDCCASDK